MRYLGVDYGSKRVGLAISDEDGTMGFPHAILPNTIKLVDDVCALIAKEKIGAVVIGESRNLAGGDNPIAEEAHLFGKHLMNKTGTQVFFESEVFTSAEARRMPTKEIKTRAPLKRNVRVDSSAAALILTSFLSRANHG